MAETTPHETTSERQQSQRCGARTRKGTPCRNWAIPNGSGKCKLHGGYSLRGKDSPTWKHGLRSKYGGPQLQAVIRELEALPTETLLSTDREIRLMEALIASCKLIDTAPQKLDTLDAVSRILERLVKAKQRGQQVMLQAMKLIPATDVQEFLTFIDETLFDALDPAQASAISEQLRKFRLSEPVQP